MEKIRKLKTLPIAEKVKLIEHVENRGVKRTADIGKSPKHAMYSPCNHVQKAFAYHKKKTLGEKK